MNKNKRPRNSTTNDRNRKKFQIATVNLNRLSSTNFEDLPNEIMYEIFELFNIYDLYKMFSNLNIRFQNLVNHPCLSLHINTSCISKSIFEQYYTQYIIPNTHRIKSFHSSNPFTIDQVNLSIFNQLETLILNNIESIELENILRRLISLPNLCSLSINTFNHPKNKTKLYRRIFRLPFLKYCKVSFNDDWNVNFLPIATNEFSPIEHLVIKTKCHLNQLNSLLSYVPQLRYLSCNDLHICYELKIETFQPILNNLTHVSLQLFNINFDRFEFLIINLFHQLQVLRISTSDDDGYLDSNRWEGLILVHMPYLRIFDIQHTNFAFNNDNDETSCQALMNQFASPFWFQRKWFFGHQHNWLGYPNNAIFYSTNPYRRKFYSLSNCHNYDMCSYHEENNLNSVRHVYLADEKMMVDTSTYFANTSELTFKHPLSTHNGLLSNTLNQIVCLTRINKIVINDIHLCFDQVITMLNLAPNCQTLILDTVLLDKQDCVLSLQNETFELVSNKNNVKSITIKHKGSSRKAKLLINLCPQLEHLTMEMSNQSFIPTVKFLLGKGNDNNHHLFSLYLLKLGITGAQQLKRLIDSEKLLVDYKLEVMKDNCYLWW